MVRKRAMGYENTPASTEPATDYRDYRKELWVGVAIAVAGSANCSNHNSPAAWADAVLAAFDIKFGREVL